jgi:fatty acid/phospholipid biosynthesis enzyme
MKTIDKNLAAAIRKADREELNMMIRIIKERQAELVKLESSSFKVGDTVQFMAQGDLIVGDVTKVNRKTINVRRTNGFGVTWRVSPSLLKKVEKSGLQAA